MSEGKHTPGPWTLCAHLADPAVDASCSCGYRGVIYGPEESGHPFAICQPGHQPAPVGEEFTEPQRYPRDVELANARLIAAAPDLLDALKRLESATRILPPDMDEPDSPLAQARAAIAKAEGGAA